MQPDLSTLTEAVQNSQAKLKQAKAEMGKVIVGQEEVTDSLFIALLADGHVLLEGLPGLAKTLTVNTLAKIMRCEFKRIQFTPDLLPADLVGTSIYNPKDGTFRVQQGPIFTNILLADEINRAPAKVQSALLEVMQERQVTIAGTSFKTGSPYLVLATQNPIEHEGTYPLPEAQTDRFMLKVRVGYPKREEERLILQRMGTLQPKVEPESVISGEEIIAMRRVVNDIYVDDKVIEYILNLVEATRYPQKYGIPIERLLLFGASPRASIALKLAAKARALLEGRAYVVPHDIRRVGYEILRHRLRRTYEAEAEDISADAIIQRIFDTIPTP